jgi:branched-chain amino acid aminotransferase
LAHGTHDYEDDPRNADVLVHVRGELVRRPDARVSVLDGGFVLGDGVWEGLRLHDGKLLFLEDHLARLWEGAKAIDLDLGMTQDELTALVRETLDANGMSTGVHVRLMVTRGTKLTPYQDPRITEGGPTVVILPEYKAPLPETLERGIRLFTVHVRRGAPDVQDPGINSHSKHNCIQACIQAAKAGADEALMLDPHGFVATCNSTHFFIVRKGEVWTSTGRYCLRGITRMKVLEIGRANGIPAKEKDFTLAEVYGADEAFVTGTFAGVAPVSEVDGRVLGDGRRGAMTKRLQDLYLDAIEAYAHP